MFPYLSDLLDSFRERRNTVSSTYSYIAYIFGSLYLNTIFIILFMTLSLCKTLEYLSEFSLSFEMLIFCSSLNEYQWDLSFFYILRTTYHNLSFYELEFDM